jgi:hypothetical protein
MPGMSSRTSDIWYTGPGFNPLLDQIDNLIGNPLRSNSPSMMSGIPSSHKLPSSGHAIPIRNVNPIAAGVGPDDMVTASLIGGAGLGGGVIDAGTKKAINLAKKTKSAAEKAASALQKRLAKPIPIKRGAQGLARLARAKSKLAEGEGGFLSQILSIFKTKSRKGLGPGLAKFSGNKIMGAISLALIAKSLFDMVGSNDLGLGAIPGSQGSQRQFANQQMQFQAEQQRGMLGLQAQGQALQQAGSANQLIAQQALQRGVQPVLPEGDFFVGE